MHHDAVQDLEVDLVLEALVRRHGYDFRHYARASLKRRLLGLTGIAGCARVVDLIPRILHEPDFLGVVLGQLSVPVSEMFRDPSVFKALKETVFPLLSSWPRLNIWQAGCAGGEEVYSLAILLDEAGLLERSQIYATDINDAALQRAEDAIFPVRGFAQFEDNYRKTGGSRTLKDYFVDGYNYVRAIDRLREKIVFAHHNLAADGVFCEVQLILCRNVLIYFDGTLQNRVLKLLHESLVRGGFLCLGTRETIRFAEAGKGFQPVAEELRIFRRSAEIES
jgi:chemotaxis protein methyltransferase CheR